MAMQWKSSRAAVAVQETEGEYMSSVFVQFPDHRIEYTGSSLAEARAARLNAMDAGRVATIYKDRMVPHQMPLHPWHYQVVSYPKARK